MDVSLIEQIKTYAHDVSLDVPLSSLTTFKVGGRAACLIRPTEEELVHLVYIFSKVREPYAVIGNGSNVVFDDEGFDGVVLLIGKNMSGITVNDGFMEVSAGTFLSEAANRAKEEGLSGHGRGDIHERRSLRARDEGHSSLGPCSRQGRECQDI